MAKWKLEGYDEFDHTAYPLEGEYPCQEDAEVAALRRLRELEKTQPAESSGGQAHHGIQDRVFIVRPDGTKYRFTG